VTAVAIALGSNLGDRVANLRAAVQRLGAEGITVAARSSVWETAPIPVDQPAFLNAVVMAETVLSPGDLLAAVRRIEYALGRRPERRWGPRPIDLDILFYGDESVQTPALVIPHPRIAERAFVLAPLSEVLPGPLPHLGKSATELLAAVGPKDLARTRFTLQP
jgi:2-amino-4-hydroxy-6-hydroxymethyldihydropteridine diphosphokinase